MIYANTTYKFTEKERDAESGYDYFGARYYDSELSRWLQVDLLADKYPGWSPYNYTLNNPINFFDPNGFDVYSMQLLWAIGGKGFGGGGSLFWVWDDQGYSGLMISFSFGGVGGSLFKVGAGVTVYDSKSIYDLEGFGYSLGAGGGTGLFAVSTENSSNFFSDYRTKFNFNVGVGTGASAWAVLTYSTLLFSASTKDFQVVKDHIINGGKVSYNSGYLVLLDENEELIKKINLNIEKKKEEKAFEFLKNEVETPDKTRVKPNQLFDYDASKN